MARTVRKVHAKAAQWSNWRSERQQALFMKGAKHYKNYKCSDASVDSDGTVKLDKRSTSASRSNHANHQIRRSARVVIARQLEDA